MSIIGVKDDKLYLAAEVTPNWIANPDKMGRPGDPASPSLCRNGRPAMIEIEGKTVLTELEELIDPAHTALIVIDMQRDFIEPEGLFGSLGIDLSMYAKSRPRLAALLGAARKAGTAVMHLQNTALPDRKSDSPAQSVQSSHAQGCAAQPAAAALHDSRHASSVRPGICAARGRACRA